MFPCVSQRNVTLRYIMLHYITLLYVMLRLFFQVLSFMPYALCL